jgi:hypothetical protein
MIPTLDMIRDYGRQFAPHSALIVMCALLGAVWGAIEAGGANTIDERPETWNLPKVALPQAVPMPEDGISDRFLVDDSRTPIKKKAPETAKKAPVDKWRFIGTVDQGKSLVAAIEVNGKSVKRVKPGDALPDGALVTKITQNVLSFEREGAGQTVSLFEEKKP